MNCSCGGVIDIDDWQDAVRCRRCCWLSWNWQDAKWKCEINWSHLIGENEASHSNETSLFTRNAFLFFIYAKDERICSNDTISLLVHSEHIKPTIRITFCVVKREREMIKMAYGKLVSPSSGYVSFFFIPFWQQQQKLSEINWSKTDAIELIS